MNITWLHRVKHLFKHKAIVLMYHRIAPVEVDPWELAVNPKNFEEQLQVLKRLYKVVSVNNLVNQLDKNKIISKSTCLTFDDGYRDNYLFAKPLLEKYQCPAVFFIPSQYVGGEDRFWWDQLQAILLSAGRLPATLSLIINKERFNYDLKNEETLTAEQWSAQKAWVWPNDPPTGRCRLYLALWEKLKPLPYGQIKVVVQNLALWAGTIQAPSQEELPITSGQLSDIKDHPLIDIGIHTVSHPALSFHSEKIQRDEIGGCRQFLEKHSGIKATTMAYPYGDYNDVTLSVVKEQQLKAAFTTQEKSVTGRSDQFSLGRFQVRNWSGREFASILSRWVGEY